MPRKYVLTAEDMAGPQKVCAHCHKTFPVAFFNRESRQTDGLYPFCKNCSRAAARASLAKYRPRYNAQKAQWKKDNKDPYRKTVIAYQKNNQRKANARGSCHRAKKLGAMPPWVKIDDIIFVYDLCPIGHHVDHIYPLIHKDFCGLHVIANLQFLTQFENFSKNNRSPEEFEELKRRKAKSVHQSS